MSTTRVRTSSIRAARQWCFRQWRSHASSGVGRSLRAEVCRETKEVLVLDFLRRRIPARQCLGEVMIFGPVAWQGNQTHRAVPNSTQRRCVTRTPLPYSKFKSRCSFTGFIQAATSGPPCGTDTILVHPKTAIETTSAIGVAGAAVASDARALLAHPDRREAAGARCPGRRSSRGEGRRQRRHANAAAALGDPGPSGAEPSPVTGAFRRPLDGAVRIQNPRGGVDTVDGKRRRGRHRRLVLASDALTSPSTFERIAAFR
jgi:hypothetical protein